MRDAQLDEPLLFEGENTLMIVAHIQKQGLKAIDCNIQRLSNIEKILEFIKI